LEITLNECLPEEARAAAADAPGTKDMRVFVTPQAFAGNIRSIEMFVLTPKRGAVQKPEIEEPVESPISATPVSIGNLLEFASPAEVLAHDVSDSTDASSRDTSSVDISRDIDATEVTVPSGSLEEPVQPAIGSVQAIPPVLRTPHSNSQSVIGHAVLTSRQPAVPTWPNIAEMKLFPAGLSPWPVRPAEVPFQAAILPREIPASGSVSTQALQEKRSWRVAWWKVAWWKVAWWKVAWWKVGRRAAIATILVLSAGWLANHFSASHRAGTTSQNDSPSPVEARMPANATPGSSQKPAETAHSSPSVRQPNPTEKLAPTLATSAPHPGARPRKRHLDADYVAKDTTVYFYHRPAGLPGNQKPQAALRNR